MYPNNQTPLPASPPPNPYDFITDTTSRSKPSLRLPGGTKGKILVAVIGLIILIILFLVISSFLGKAGKQRLQQYVEVTKRQTEIIRLSTIAQDKAKTLETRSFATTAKLSFTSSQKDLTTVLTKNGVSSKDLSKQLTASKNTKSDAILDEAEKNNRFDETFTELISTEISNYTKQLSALANGSTPSEKKILETAFNQSTILLGITKP